MLTFFNALLSPLREAKEVWKEAPGSPESIDEYTRRKRAAADSKFQSMLAKCPCAKCEKRREEARRQIASYRGYNSAEALERMRAMRTQEVTFTFTHDAEFRGFEGLLEDQSND